MLAVRAAHASVRDAVSAFTGGVAYGGVDYGIRSWLNRSHRREPLLTLYRTYVRCQAAVEFQHAIELTADREALRGFPGHPGCDFVAPFWNRLKRGSEGVGGRRHDPAGFTQDVAVRGGIRGDDERSGRKGLGLNQALRLGRARHHERVGAGVEIGQLLARDDSEKPNVGFDT